MATDASSPVPAHEATGGDVPGRFVGALRARLPGISARAYRRILVVVLALVALIIFTGALVRLTNSGLGCPQWPSCSLGQVLRAPDNHGRIELFNRYLTGWIAAIVAVLGLTSIVRRPYRRTLVRLSLLLLIGVVGQAILGGITVLLKLKPQAVMGHFLLSIALLSAALVLHERSARDTDEMPPVEVSRAASYAARTLIVAASATVVLGTVVTSSGPHGGDDIAERFAYSMRSVARLHSGAAWALVAVAVLIGWKFRIATTDGERLIQRRVGQLLATLVMQGGVGYTQYVTRVPAWLVAVHIVGVVAVWCAALRVAFPLWSPTVAAFEGGTVAGLRSRRGIRFGGEPGQ